MTIKRMLSGSIEVGTDESRSFSADLSKWVVDWGAITGIESCTLYDRTKKEDASIKLSGLASYGGTVVESKTVSGLEDKHYYQLNVLVNFPGGHKLSGYFPIVCRR